MALLFHEKDIPSPGPLRDDVLTSIMGSFDAHSSDDIIDGTIHSSGLWEIPCMRGLFADDLIMLHGRALAAGHV